MAKEIKFCLLFRDMWQSSGKYVPRVDQLVKVAPYIIEMGCFSRIETNGGGFEQINLLFGENPNVANRKWTQPFNDAGIQTQMLERALNGIRMNPVPADVRKLMFKVKKIQGTDIARSFCGLNDPRNLENSIKFAKEGGMISQTAMSVTYSKVHTVEYYSDLAEQLIKKGADEICIKDMAGIGRPVFLGKIVKNIKDKHPDIIVQYHGHSGPGFSVASTLEVVKAGADIIDVAMEPLSWGTGHADLLTIHEMLRDAGYDVPEINMNAYMKVRSIIQEMIDDFLGYYINPKNRFMNSLLIGPGLPGGMMGSLMADLENNLKSLNKWFVKNNKPVISQDNLLIKLFDEVAYIWPKLGYPPLVTPFSQYVKNVALMNVMQMEKGKERWTMIDDSTWDMILGKSGKLPGKIDDEIIQLANEQGREFFNGVPQDLYPDALESFKKEMKEKKWDFGQDDEELLEFAMHKSQYEAYKSGKAKKDFEADLSKRKAEKEKAMSPSVVPETSANYKPKTMNIDVNGEVFTVSVSYDINENAQDAPPKADAPAAKPSGNVNNIIAPIEGKFFFTKDSAEIAVKEGDMIKKGENIGYIESMKVYNAITSPYDGKIVEILVKNDSDVDEDDIIFRVQ
ncbi:MAG: oxaloacetate decarboxylase [Chlorobi bacterium]|nr:oxaloacetate decarboxylase [Chlorobiota bacterium]